MSSDARLPGALRIDRRRLRLTSGLVLFTYVGLHLLNHALGLISLRMAEDALRLAVAVWHSPPGTAVLYGAAAIHVALAFESLYSRRTLRMPAIEWLRIVLGFGMPILLIGHVVATRAAFELYGLDPAYSRIVRGIWASGNEWLQLGLLAPGWIHGCLGLHIAFGHRRGYRRVFLASYALAVLLPVVSALGFWAMSRELTREPLPAAARSASGEAVGVLRRQVLYGYGALFLLVAAARVARLQWQRRRRELLRVDLPQGHIELPRGWSVLDGLRSHGVAHASVCGGRARCSTCRVRVIEGLANCPQASAAEAGLLSRLGQPDDVRLACQLRPAGDLRILPLMAVNTGAGARPVPAMSSERDVVLFRLGIARTEGQAGTCLTADVWHVLQALVRLSEDLLQRGNGHLAHLADDHVMLAFDGHGSDPEVLRLLVRRAESEITRLAADTLSGLASPMRITLHVHRGPVLLNQLDVDHIRVPVVIGEAVAELQRWAAAHGTAPGIEVSGGDPAASGPALCTPQAARWLSEPLQAKGGGRHQ